MPPNYQSHPLPVYFEPTRLVMLHDDVRAGEEGRTYLTRAKEQETQIASMISYNTIP